MKSITINWFVLLLIALISVKCQKEIVIPQLPYESKVVIQGIVEPDSFPIVYINRTVPYLSGTTDPADLIVRNATVTISSKEGTDPLYLDSVYIAFECKYAYFYKGNSVSKANTTYTLTVVDGTKTHTATTTTSLKPVTISRVSYTPNFKDLYGTHEGVITYFTDIPGENNYYRFEMKRKVYQSTRYVTGNGRDLLVPCLAEGDTIMFTETGRSVYNDENLQGKEIKLVIEPALTHLVEVTVFIRIITIDKNAYEFYDRIDGQKLAQFNPFIEPVFILPGQFGSGALGFFSSIIRSNEMVLEMPADD